MKTRLKLLFEKETIDILMGSFNNAAWYGVRYSREGDSRITESQGYGMLMALLRCTTQVPNASYITELFFGSNLDGGFVLLAVERQRKVEWTYVAWMMEDSFLWYDENTGRIVQLPMRDCRQVTITADKLLANWCTSSRLWMSVWRKPLSGRWTAQVVKPIIGRRL